jgi:hypothetical protein
MKSPNVHTAMCDPEAFYPLRSLVSGPLETLDELPEIERFIRTVVLHDEMVMELTPSAYDPETDFEFTKEERLAGGRNVIVAMGPTLKGYDFFEPDRNLQVPEIELSPALVQVASKYANATEGNVYFEAHIEHMKRVFGNVERGGSVLMCSKFGQEAIATTTKYPEQLFQYLDEEWRKFARAAQEDGLGLLVPPILGIVLRRCSSRQEIPSIIQEIRDEWAAPRRKVWACISALRFSENVKEAETIRRELSEASRLFAPSEIKPGSPPIRIFWEIVAATVAGAAIGQFDKGTPVVGALTGAILRSMPELGREFGRTLFGRGAFDLANTIRREAGRVEYNELSRLLTTEEKRRLGLGWAHH